MTKRQNALEDLKKLRDAEKLSPSLYVFLYDVLIEDNSAEELAEAVRMEANNIGLAKDRIAAELMKYEEARK